MKKQVVSLVFMLGLGAVASSPALAVSEEASSNGVPSLAPMLEEVTPAVVIVSTSQATRAPDALRFLGEDDLRRFFNDQQGQANSRPVRGTGSGVIVDAEKGYIVTNHHVIADADEIMVTLQDGREFTAKLLGSDASTDVALLEIEGDQLQELAFADIDDLRVGDYVVAVGNPFGLGQTVTQGIVSALGRSGLNNDNYEDFIQTDAAINMGNSGGALVDLEGRLVGINTAIISGTGTNAGIAFAVPVDMIASVVTHLERDGEVRRGQLGVQIQDLTSAMETALQTGAGKGALVTSVVPGSAAEAAGIEASDVIVEIDGRKIESGRELRNVVGLMSQNQEVELLVFRDGESKRVKAVVSGGQPSVAVNAPDEGRQLADPAYQGAQLRSLDQSAGAGKGGVEVVNVAQGSPAWQAGLRPGDVIFEVNRSEVATLQEFNQRVDDDAPVTALGVLRENRRMLVIMS
jgi:Do/DeqQ family serine protease